MNQPIAEADKVGPANRVGRAVSWMKRPELSLIRKGIKGVSWSALSQIVEMVIRIGSSLVMTRLLTKEDYGVFGIAMIVVTTLEWFADLGVMQALMRHPDGLTRSYLMTGWWINVFRGLILTSIVMIIAYPLGAYVYYEVPSFTPILLAVGLVSAIQSFKTPGMPKINHDLNYRALFFLRISQTASSTIVMIVAAYFTGSVWSVVAGTLCGYAVVVAVSYLLSPIRPDWVWNRDAVREVSKVTRMFLPNTLCMALMTNTYLLMAVWLKIVTVGEFGLLNLANSLASAGESFLMAGGNVYFAMLVQMKDETERNEWHRRVLRYMAFGLMPALCVTILIAPLVVRALYTRDYWGAGIPLAILVARAMVRFAGLIQFQQLVVQSRIKYTTIGYIIAWIVQTLLLLGVGESLGLNGLALTSLVAVMVQVFVQALLASRHEESLKPILITFALIVTTLSAAAMIYRI